MPTDMTLYSIETSIIDMLNLRDGVADDPDITPAERDESLKAIDQSIAEYVSRELRKVDGCAHVLREFRARIGKRSDRQDGWETPSAIDTEIERLKQRKKSLIAQHDYLEGKVLQAVEFVIQQTGAKKLEGETSTLKIAKCPASVEVRQPELVPSQMQRVSVKMTMLEWERISAVVNRADSGIDTITVEVGAREPIKVEIARELKAGRGVAGCSLVTDKVRLVVE